MASYGKRIQITGKRWTTTREGQKSQEVHYRYEEKITALLEQIELTRTGYILLDAIESHPGGGTVTIQPPLAAVKRACYAGLQLHSKGGKLLKDAAVDFVPSSFGSACPGVGTSPEEVLFHELVHGMQTAQGVLDRSPIPKAPKMTDFSEFCAVTASNIFRSDLGRAGLRAGHEGRDAAVTLTDSAAYYAFFRTEIDRWFRIQPLFCRHVAHVPGLGFNPLRAAVSGKAARA